MLLESLDTFIGLITIFLVLSLIVSALGEGVGNVLNLKGHVLEQSLQVLLGKDDAQRFFEHESVVRLCKPGFWNAKKVRPPSYVPDAVVANVIVDLCVNRPAPAPPPASPPAQPTPINPNSVDRALAALSTPYAGALRELWQRAEFDVDGFKTAIAGWFNLTGDRSTGWFRRRLGFLLFGLGFVVAIGLNADTIHMFDSLSSDATLRSEFVERATEIVNTTKQAEDTCGTDAACRERVRADACGAVLKKGEECTPQALIHSTLPEIASLIGLDLLPGEYEKANKANRKWLFVILKLLGWTLTAAAVSLGAPFWFDLLQKIVQVRTSVRPPETPAPAPGDDADKAKPASGSITVDAPRARALIRVAATADAEAFETLAHFEADKFGFSPVNLFWCARLAELAYVLDGELVKQQLAEWGAEGELLSTGDTQCVVACTPKAAFIVFRGTEQCLEDWMTDLKATLEAPKWNAAAPYEVHQGFNEALDLVWNAVDGALTQLRVYERALPIWLCGHSLGGALAALAALRLREDLDKNGRRNVIACLHTIGQPRVGNAACAQALDAQLPSRYFRSINNRDVVPRVPLPQTPDLLAKIKAIGSPLQIHAYEHGGRVVYFTDTGKAMMDPPLWYRGLDTLAVGLTKADIVNAMKQTVGDHNAGGYVRLQRALVAGSAAK
ncbi:MAG TPA: lipase family protein [Gammaproteobacteria bacterium]|nr:lipase family protein [Gammaproteobacteria bacterium]